MENKLLFIGALGPRDSQRSCAGVGDSIRCAPETSVVAASSPDLAAKSSRFWLMGIPL